MMEAVRNGAWAKAGGGAPTAKDYVQDGLIAMWDGIENAGWGQHDANATTWKDLSGNGWDLALESGGFSWSDRCIQLLNAVASRSEIPSNYKFVEVVYRQLEQGVDFVFGTSFAGKHMVLLGTRDRGITFHDAYNHRAEHSLHPLESSKFVGLIFSAGCAYDQNDNGIETQMYFNGNNELPTGGVSGWSARNGLHPDTSYAKKSELYSLRLHSRILTDAEVAANYAIDKARFDLP